MRGKGRKPSKAPSEPQTPVSKPGDSLGTFKKCKPTRRSRTKTTKKKVARKRLTKKKVTRK